MTPQTATSEPTLTVDDFEQLAEKVDKAIAEVQSQPKEARGKAMALKSAIEEFHKVGLTAIVRKLKDDPRGKELLFELVDEPAVYSLFAMHGLIRADLQTRVARVIEMVRPYMQSHGGDVALVDVQRTTARVRLSGNCNGCSMSAVTLKNTVEEALAEHVPEISAVEVVPEDKPPKDLVQIQKPDQGGVPKAEHGWVSGPLEMEVKPEKAVAVRAGEHEILLIRCLSGVKAYRNACAHQGMPLDGGLVDPEAGTITCPFHGFQFDSESGECFSAPACQLESFPVRVDAGRIYIRPTN